MWLSCAVDPRVQRAAILVSQGERNLGRMKNACGDVERGRGRRTQDAENPHARDNSITRVRIGGSPRALFTLPRFRCLDKTRWRTVKLDDRPRNHTPESHGKIGDYAQSNQSLAREIFNNYFYTQVCVC